MLIFLLLLCVTTAQAFDRNKVNLDNFWGSWSVFNPKTTCTESFQFVQPGKFSYQAQAKQLVGEFALIRTTGNEKLDHLLLEIYEDNVLVGCEEQASNYKGQKSGFYLKLISLISAELCADPDGKNCTGLFLNRKEN